MEIGINQSFHNGASATETWNNESARLISVIGPCYNERDNIQPFIETVESTMENEGYEYEILMVNDGSTDGSAELLEELRLTHPRLKVIHLIRNFGQQAAMLAGICEARGRIMVTMDTDLQHPVEVIPEMIRKWEQGADVVYAIPNYRSSTRKTSDVPRKNYGKPPLYKVTSSGMYQSIISRFQEPGQTYVSTDFRLFDREVAEVIRKLPERNIYLRNVFAWLCPISEVTDLQSASPVSGCFRSVCIPYRMGRRQHGTTKYSIGQLIRLGIMGLTNGGIRPLSIGVQVGLIALLVSVIVVGIQLLYHGMTWSSWQGWEIVLLAGLLVGSIQLIMLCLIGTYAGKIYLQGQGRPLYYHRNPVLKNKKQKWSVKQEQVPLSLSKD
ncbi:MAG TPA: glycosyltransferase family 2 protein [Membranihabitans sp.]|nr:glycosyltransferase family 2 protein [Membranihabitans sp.]